MRGLLLKDWYIALKTCRLQLGVIVIMTVLSLFLDVGMAYLIYPILFAGMIPVYIQSVEEKYDWPRYAQALPVSRRQIVSEKYIATLLCVAGTILFMFLAWAIRAAAAGSALAEDFTLAGLLLCVGLLFPLVNLPAMFKLGVEKGRVLSVVTIGALIAILFVAEYAAGDAPYEGAPYAMGLISRFGPVIPPAVLAVLALFFLSWLLAVKLYEAREL